MTERIFANRITVPQFEIVSNPTISIANIKQRRFTLIDRDAIEPSIERIIDDVLIFRRRDDEYELTREYIIKHIRKYKTFENLRTAIKEVAAEFEPMVDRLGVLK